VFDLGYNGMYDATLPTTNSTTTSSNLGDYSASDSDSSDTYSDDSADSGHSVASNYNSSSAQPSTITVRTAKQLRPSVHTMTTRSLCS
jgi:hypothetical protein